jgi:hypothetical protein
MSSRRSTPLRLAVATTSLVVLAFVSSACSGETQPGEYGEAYQANFMIGCTGVEPQEDGTFTNPSLGSPPFCDCVYQGLEEKVPFEQAKEFEDQQAESEPGEITIPDNINQVYEACKASNPAPAQ